MVLLLSILCLPFPKSLFNEVGTLAYKAPELLLRMRQSTTAVDMWSVGCIFAEMAKGKPFFSGTTDLLLMKDIIRILGVPTEIDWPGLVSASLERMLCFIPDQRITAHDALQHQYFKLK